MDDYLEAESAEMKPRSSTLLNPCINLLESSHNAPIPKPVARNRRLMTVGKLAPQ